MSLVFSFKRRSSLAICLAILKAAKNGTKKTHLLNSVSLSYGQMIRYAEFLKHCGFVEEYCNMLRTTDKGLELIREYESSSLIHVLTSA
jgi:predicted transcriptional regulator